MPNGSAHYLVLAGRNLSLLTKLLCPLVSRSGHGTLLPDDIFKHSLHRCPHSLGCGLRLLGFEKVLDTDLVRRLSHRLASTAEAFEVPPAQLLPHPAPVPLDWIEIRGTSRYMQHLQSPLRTKRSACPRLQETFAVAEQPPRSTALPRVQVADDALELARPQLLHCKQSFLGKSQPPKIKTLSTPANC